MVAIGNENLTGNPNMQLGGLLRPPPSEEDRQFLEEVLDYEAIDGQVRFRCRTNLGEEATVALTPISPHVVRVTLSPGSVPVAPRATACLVQHERPAACVSRSLCGGSTGGGRWKRIGRWERNGV